MAIMSDMLFRLVALRSRMARSLQFWKQNMPMEVTPAGNTR